MGILFPVFGCSCAIPGNRADASVSRCCTDKEGPPARIPMRVWSPDAIAYSPWAESAESRSLRRICI